MICCLVSNETTNLACFTVNTILFVCLPFIVLFSLFECPMEKESLPPFLSSDDSPFPPVLPVLYLFILITVLSNSIQS